MDRRASQGRHRVASDGLGVGKGNVGMSTRKTQREWGTIRKQPTKSARYQASYVGPDLRRHYAPVTFSSKMIAERWLDKEKQRIDRCAASDEGTVVVETARSDHRGKQDSQPKLYPCTDQRWIERTKHQGGHANRIQSQIRQSHQTETGQDRDTRSESRPRAVVVLITGNQDTDAQRSRLFPFARDLRNRCQ